MKICTGCGEQKAFSEFYKEARNKNGCRSRCKLCCTKETTRVRQANSEKAREQLRRYRSANREKVREWDRNYRNSPKRQKYLASYVVENAEKISERRRQWLARNPDKSVSWVEARRVRLIGAAGSHTTAEWQELCAKYRHQCLACGASDVRLTRDHIVPLSRGGDNYIDNIQPLCRSCNAKKGTKTHDYR